jgi:hypothetical protein
MIEPRVQRPWVDEVRHRKLANTSKPLKERRSDELNLFFPQLNEIVNRITDLVLVGQISVPSSALDPEAKLNVTVRPYRMSRLSKVGKK